MDKPHMMTAPLPGAIVEYSRVTKLPGRRILVVEDEAAIALDIARLLGDQGATVIGPVASADQALSQITRTRLHCAVLDVKLGTADCGMVAETLTWNAIPFIFVTGYSDSEVVRRYPWSPVITKPYIPLDVIDSIKSVLVRN
jgi:CheY-like chemotaxis protein